MSETVRCDCARVECELQGEPRVRAMCHCPSCQALYNVPFLALAAWAGDALTVRAGEEALGRFQYPGKALARLWCRECGATVYSTNRFGFAVVPQALLRKAHGGSLPGNLAPDRHLFYAHRVVDVNDDLPKYLEGIDGPLHRSGA